MEERNGALAVDTATARKAAEPSEMRAEETGGFGDEREPALEESAEMDPAEGREDSRQESGEVEMTGDWDDLEGLEESGQGTDEADDWEPLEESEESGEGTDEADDWEPLEESEESGEEADEAENWDGLEEASGLESGGADLPEGRSAAEETGGETGESGTDAESDSLASIEPMLDERIVRAVREMGFERLTPIQVQAIPYLLDGEDIIGQAQTGTGKTAAFAIPALQKIDPDLRKLQTVILCPTRELAMQAAEEIRNIAKYMHGIKVLPVYGGQEISKQIKGLRDVQIIVGTPGRVMDHMRRHTIKLDYVNMVVLDEADEMLDMGFREDMELILGEITNAHQTALFSATMPQPILEIANQFQKDARLVRVAAKELTIPLVSQRYYRIKSQDKDAACIRLLEYYQPRLCLIFCNTKIKVDELSEVLKKGEFRAEGLHGDMSQHQRDVAMNHFRNGSTNILIATDVAARGIDVDNVEVVINYDLPLDNEYYVHRIGRTGRAGKTGRSFTFVSGREMFRLRQIERFCHTTIEEREIPDVSKVIQAKAEKYLNLSWELHEHEDIELMRDYVERKIEEEGCEILELAAAMLKYQIGDLGPEIEADNSESRRGERDSRRGGRRRRGRDRDEERESRRRRDRDEDGEGRRRFGREEDGENRRRRDRDEEGESRRRFGREEDGENRRRRSRDEAGEDRRRRSRDEEGEGRRRFGRDEEREESRGEERDTRVGFGNEERQEKLRSRDEERDSRVSFGRDEEREGSRRRDEGDRDSRRKQSREEDGGSWSRRSREEDGRKRSREDEGGSWNRRNRDEDGGSWSRRSRDEDSQKRSREDESGSWNRRNRDEDGGSWSRRSRDEDSRKRNRDEGGGSWSRRSREEDSRKRGREDESGSWSRRGREEDSRKQSRNERGVHGRFERESERERAQSRGRGDDRSGKLFGREGDRDSRGKQSREAGFGRTSRLRDVRMDGSEKGIAFSFPKKKKK